MSETYLWHLWPGRHWPASMREEQAFIERLRAGHTRTPRKFERGDITATLNLLRLGITLEGIAPYAPGLKGPRLNAAYNDLESRLLASRNAFLHILDDPTSIESSDLAPLASRLAPVPTYHLLAAALALREHTGSHERVEATIDEVQRLMDLAAARVARAEKTLETLTTRYEELLSVSTFTSPSSDPAVDEVASHAVLLGKELYDPYDTCLWSDPFYLPRRLTDLVPGRVADLLGEADA